MFYNHLGHLSINDYGFWISDSGFREFRIPDSRLWIRQRLRGTLKSGIVTRTDQASRLNVPSKRLV